MYDLQKVRSYSTTSMGNHFVVSLFPIFLQFAICMSRDIITINQTLQDGQLLLSEGNKFALGFFSPGRSGYRYLGIWFHKVSEGTVVWVANRNHPINGSTGVLSMSQDGSLVLYRDSERKLPVWSANATAKLPGTYVAQLLDSGNLILVQETGGRPVWQSFDYPSNTVITGMVIGPNLETGVDRVLTSWRSADDPADGDYSFRLDWHGSPQLFLCKGSKSYWRSYPWPWTVHVDIANYRLVNNQHESYCIYDAGNDSSLILRIVLDESGLLKRQTWHDTDGRWKVFDYRPNSRCDWYGICGPGSACNINDFSSNRYECACLPGYIPKYPRDWSFRDGSGGCIRKRQEPSLLCNQGEGFMKVRDAKLPDTSKAVWLGMRMSRIECEQQCLRNCSCSAYASMEIAEKGTGCLTWYGEILDTVESVGDGYELYVRVDAIELAENAMSSRNFRRLKEIFFIMVLPAASAWLILIIFGYICLWRRKKSRIVKRKWNERNFDRITKHHEDDLTELELGVSRSHPDLESFSLSAIVAATDNFSPANKLGQGGFGSVYKGQLPNGSEVAVKRLSENSGQGIEEFCNEATLIAMLQHRNLVKLLGCCIDRGNQMLVYEYLPNKSLDSHLFDETRSSLLDWRKRFDIILGIARGILYLHQDSRLRIVHRDLKCSNVLLDADMNPKISDFGIARTLKGDQFQDKTKTVVGTYGYMSPEYAVFGKFSVKSDVFSFGVMLLEIVSGKKNTKFQQSGPYFSLIGHVWDLWKEDRTMEIVDSSLESYVPYEVLRCIQVGLLCVQEDAGDRPTMLETVLMLSSETTLPRPKQPAFIFRKCCGKSYLPLEEEEAYSLNEITLTSIQSR